jgi:N-acetyl-gamma-glutamyl-phosphate reductase
MIKASVIGATGYAGAELMRLLTAHPKVIIMHAVSKSFAGQKMSALYPSFFSNDYTLEELDFDAIAKDSDIVFTCLPHGASAETAAQLVSRGAKVIDLSGDFRYSDVSVYERWYQIRHVAPNLLAESVYGMPELYRERIKKARLIGNPGCYTTCAILAAAPLLKAGAVCPHGIVIDAKSGVTGAGRSEKLAYNFCEVDESLKAYGVATHRHTSEIEQELSLAADAEVVVSFTPHLLPVKRGILSTIYLTPNPGVTEEHIADAYAVYKDEPFVQVTGEALPEIKHVTGSNNCAIGYVLDKRAGRLVVVSVLDNLIKGAAGQAVQNMNLICGFDETAGLNNMGWYL